MGEGVAGGELFGGGGVGQAKIVPGPGGGGGWRDPAEPPVPMICLPLPSLLITSGSLLVECW